MIADVSQLVGKHVHREMATEKYPDGTFAQVIKTEFNLPDDNTDQDIPTDAVRAYKAGRDAGGIAVLEWVRSWMGAIGISGVRSQGAWLAYALKSFPDVTYAEFCAKAGILKQTGYIAKERAEAVLPLLRLMAHCDPEQIKNQQRAMAESWKRRRKKKPDAANVGNEAIENHGGSQ